MTRPSQFYLNPIFVAEGVSVRSQLPTDQAGSNPVLLAVILKGGFMNHSEAGRLGGIARYRKYGSPMKNKETALKSNTAEKSRLGGFASHLNNRMKNGQARRMGLLSRKYENEIAGKLKYAKIYLPSEVCDRIVVEKGKILFIEIKRKGQKLTRKQQEFSEIAKDSFKIIYG